MKYKVGDKVKIRKGSLAGNICTISHIASCGHIKLSDLPYVFFDYELEPADADGGKIAYAPNGAALFWMPEPEKPVSIEEQLGLPKGVSIHDLPTSEWIDKIALPTATETKEMVERVRREILKFTNAFPKEEKKLKFTFYTVDTSRINKTNNTKVDTVMTCVHIGDKVGYATCDKEDYDEREGILNAIANLCCDGSFDKAYRKAVKEKKISETLDRTCSYCRKVFDTVAEREAHEAWHIERRKARRERYLLRKRAKEIAFEEQAQKMAKEMMGEQK